MKLLFLVLIAAIVLMGCGGTGATTPSVVEMTQAEYRLFQYLQCYARAHNLKGTVELALFDGPRIDKGGGLIICQTWPLTNQRTGKVECWKQWVNGDTQYEVDDHAFSSVASHEICHMTGLWDEQSTGACASQYLNSGVCL